MGIPFIDLAAQYQALKSDVVARMDRVFAHGNYIMGPEVRELEQTLASYVGAEHAVGCASGTDAILLPLMALGVGPGDAVFTTPFTFIATAEVISLLGATPVFVDIDPVTYNIDAKQLDAAIRALKDRDPHRHPLPAGFEHLTPRGVITVDLYGLPADYDALQAACSEHGLFLIEDAAQSFGGEYKGKKACAFGDVAATSFFPAKPLGCYGDGGMVFTGRKDLAEIMQSIRVHGKGKDKYDNVRIGLNARLDTLQAAILLAKFKAFPAEIQARQERALAYANLLAQRLPEGSLPIVPEGYLSAWAQYTLRLPPPLRDEAEAALRSAGIPTAVYYPKPLHLQSAFHDLGYRLGDFPEAERASREVLSLPFGPHLRNQDGESVAQALGSVVTATRAKPSP